MEIPFELRTALERLLQDADHGQLVRDSQNISLRYRTRVLREAKWIGHDLETGDILAMGDIHENREQHESVEPPENGEFPEDGELPESNELSNNGKLLPNAEPPENSNILRKADLVIASYVLNEMSEDARRRTVQKLWESAGMILLLVEPGTPAGFSNLNEARKILVEQGAFIAAPCPHSAECPMEADDWCHFTCRVARSRLHRRLKGGDAPFEDEKFSYLAFAREACSRADMRILRHPQVRGGHIMLKVYTKDGIADITLTKKDGERYKEARKAVSGDELD